MAFRYGRGRPHACEGVHRQCTSQSFCLHCKLQLIPLQEVPERLQEDVHNGVRQRFPEIMLQLYGTKVSDGYRLPLERARPPPFMEENITRLMDMGLANRERAIHVLQAHANDLEAAVAMLLALL